MLIEAIMSSPVSELSYNYSKAETVIASLERPVNDNILKLMCSRAPADLQLRWREEIIDWLGRMAEIRMRPDHYPAPSSFYFRLLFEEPYGTAAEANVTCCLRRIGRHFHMNYFVEVEQVVARLREFHRGFADLASSGLNLADSEDEQKIADLVAAL